MRKLCALGCSPPTRFFRRIPQNLIYHPIRINLWALAMCDYERNGPFTRMKVLLQAILYMHSCPTSIDLLTIQW